MDTDKFANAVQVFSYSVEKMSDVQMMIAANEERASKGLAQAYGEGAFAQVSDELARYRNAMLP